MVFDCFLLKLGILNKYVMQSKTIYPPLQLINMEDTDD